MKPARFEYCRPETVDEAVALLAEFGSDAVVLAGGLSLGAMLNMRLVRPAAVIDINRVAGLGAVASANGAVVTGALVRQAAALADRSLGAAVPLLALALPHVGHYQTRARGTLAGSVAHADPSAELPLVLATLGGEVELRAASGARRVGARTFFQGALTTARAADELVTGLIWPRRGGDAGFAFEEFARRHGDFAIVAAAALARVAEDGSIAELVLGLGGVEDRPVIVAEARFVGAPATPETAREIAAGAARAVDPMADPQASAEYRRQLVAALGARVLRRAFEPAAREG